jgi:small-conductance mechanosensitive channel
MREAVGVILRYAIVLLGVLVILQSEDIDLTSLNVLVGAIGVGLGCGLQNITSNFFSGLILLFERPLKVGDRIEIGGVTGEVREIGARATTIVTDENVATLVSSSQLVSERVTNWSRPGRLTAYVVPFNVSYASDLLLVRKILLAAASAHAGVLSEPPPEVEFAEVGPSTLRFQLQVWSVEHLKSSGGSCLPLEYRSDPGEMKAHSGSASKRDRANSTPWTLFPAARSRERSRRDAPRAPSAPAGDGPRRGRARRRCLAPPQSSQSLRGAP